MAKRELIGSIFTDVAQVVVGDPCKLIQGEGGPPRLTYEQYMDLWPDERKFGGDLPFAYHVAVGKSAAVAVRTVENCDGWCDVYVERDKEGRPRRMVVDLNTKVKPGVPTTATEAAPPP